MKSTVGLFADFACQWTPVEFTRRLRRKPLRVQVAGANVVLFRGPDGRAAALLDRCPHRGVALSLGRVTELGHLQCPFHGWEFDASGGCAHVPYNDLPDAKRGRLGAMALGVREIGGLVWVFTGSAEQVQGGPVVPDALTDRAFVHYRHAEVWNTHWTRAMENMLDWPHLPYVHRRTIGRGMRRALARTTVMHTTFEPTPTGARIAMRIDGAAEEVSLLWGRPNGMVLDISPPGRRIKQHIWCVPVDAWRTKMVLVSSRDFGRYNPVMGLFDRFSRIILTEDRAVLESSDPPAVPHPREEMSVASDAATLAFRQHYLRVMLGHADEAALVPAERLVARAR